MCGLLGFIGESKNPEATKKLVTCLFARTQIRGMDASGFYCVSDFYDKNIFYHKQPIPSINYVNTPEYLSLWQNKLSCGLFHCRAASAGVGIPAFNKNNHPFVSSSLAKAVIHNGVIEKTEYDLLKVYYEVETECDSEIILRMLEQEDIFQNNISKFLDYTTNSHYAVAYCDVRDNERNLYLFRNEHRPLFLADFTKELGQIFFFSTSEILFSALSDAGINIKSPKIYEIKPHQLFHIKYDSEKLFHVEQYHYEIANENKQELSYMPLRKDVSEYKNIIELVDSDINAYIKDMYEKFKENVDSISDPINSYINRANNEKTKILGIFGFFKDANKKLEQLRKILLEE